MNANTQSDKRITLKKLIQMLPFTDEVRDQLLGVLDKLSPDQRYELSDLCWEMFEQLYMAEKQYKVNSAILEMAKGGKGFAPSDFAKMGEEIAKTFTQKLGVAEETQKITEIRQRLKTQSLPLDKTIPSPPPPKF